MMWMELECCCDDGNTCQKDDIEQPQQDVHWVINSCDVGGSERCIRFPIRYIPSHHNLKKNIELFNIKRNALYGLSPSASSSSSKVMETLVMCGLPHCVCSDVLEEEYRHFDVDDEFFNYGFPMSSGGGWGSLDDDTASSRFHLKFTYYFQDMDPRAQTFAAALRPATVEFDIHTCSSPTSQSNKRGISSSSPKQKHCRAHTRPCSQLSNTIHDKYFSNMPYLQKITLSPQLLQVTRIHSDFLSKCPLLLEIDLSPLRNVTRIGEMFLAFCSGLTALDVSPLSNVVKVGKFFLSGCSSLQTLDLTPMGKSLEIAELSIYACKNLKIVTAPKHLLHRVRPLGNIDCRVVANN